MTKSVRLIYFSQFYSPESIAGSFRAAENASLWTKSGNQVHVFTGYPNYPTGKVFEGYNVKNLSIDIVDGIKVFRSKLSAVPNTSTINRLKNALSYYLYGRINTIFRDKNIWDSYDAVIGSSGPIFNALLAEKYAQKHKIPFIFDIRDITYVQMQATGRSANTLSVRIMRALELHLCKKAAKVVVVTNGFKEKLITEGISETRIDVITNGVDVLPTPKSNIEGEIYTVKKEPTLGGDYLIRKEEDGKVKALIHVYQTGDMNGITSILFRDYLNKYEDERKKYEELKIELYNKYKDERKKYTSGKDKYIKEIIAKAIEESKK